MATDLCVQYTLDLGTDLFLNQGGSSGTTTTIRTTAITGLDGRPIQVTILPNGATSGSDKLTGQFRGRVIRVQGDIWVYSAGELLTPADAVTNGSVTAYLTAVNTLVDAWVAGLEAVLNSTFTLSWTPTGLGADSLTVSYGVEGGEFQSVPPAEFNEWTSVSFSLFAESG
jgi:hypothetical protein